MFKNNKKIIQFITFLSIKWATIAQSVQGLATDWRVRGSNPDEVGEIYSTCPDRPWGITSLLYKGYRVFPGVKSGLGVTLKLTPF
jgi:hypothetical protein